MASEIDGGIPYMRPGGGVRKEPKDDKVKGYWDVDYGLTKCGTCGAEWFVHYSRVNNYLCRGCRAIDTRTPDQMATDKLTAKAVVENVRAKFAAAEKQRRDDRPDRAARTPLIESATKIRMRELREQRKGDDQ